jgi:hypothetical protein
MKKVFLFLMFICANVLAWGQTEKGKAALEKANAGDASAQSEVAEYYEFGEEGFEKDAKQALAWYTKAADQNDNFALGKLKSAYQSGKLGVAKNDEKYIYYLKKHAECGNLDSMIDLAVYRKVSAFQCFYLIQNISFAFFHELYNVIIAKYSFYVSKIILYFVPFLHI